MSASAIPKIPVIEAMASDNVVLINTNNTSVQLAKPVEKVINMKPRQDGNIDKPGYLFSTVPTEISETLRLCSNNMLHGFIANGRSITRLNNYSTAMLKSKLEINLIPKPDFSTGSSALQLANEILAVWSQCIYENSQSAKCTVPVIAFIRVKNASTNKIYLPCCNDVKVMTNDQVLSHYQNCLTERSNGTACAFCNNTNQENGNFKDIKDKGVHVLSNNHLNAVYQVLCVNGNDLAMRDSRVIKDFICCRPLAYYFMYGIRNFLDYANFLEFLLTHINNAMVENTPFINITKKMVRMAKRDGHDIVTIPCHECDNLFSAFSAFQLGPLLNGQPAHCMCGNQGAYNVTVVALENIQTNLSDLIASRKSKGLGGVRLEDLMTKYFGSDVSKTNLTTYHASIDMVQLYTQVNAVQSNTVHIIGSTTVEAVVSNNKRSNDADVTKADEQNGLTTTTIGNMEVVKPVIIVSQHDEARKRVAATTVQVSNKAVIYKKPNINTSDLVVKAQRIEYGKPFLHEGYAYVFLMPEDDRADFISYEWRGHGISYVISPANYAPVGFHLMPVPIGYAVKATEFNVLPESRFYGRPAIFYEEVVPTYDHAPPIVPAAFVLDDTAQRAAAFDEYWTRAFKEAKLDPQLLIALNTCKQQAIDAAKQRRHTLRSIAFEKSPRK